MSKSSGRGIAGCAGKAGVAEPVGGSDARAEAGARGVAGPDMVKKLSRRATGVCVAGLVLSSISMTRDAALRNAFR
jgi:hypothetical protein